MVNRKLKFLFAHIYPYPVSVFFKISVWIRPQNVRSFKLRTFYY